MPIVLSRTYRPNDNQTRSFGIGTTNSYEIYLTGDTMAYSYADLVLPDGGKIRYVRTSPGTLRVGSVMQHTSSPTGFYGSTLWWDNASGWNIKLKNGTLLRFHLSTGSGNGPAPSISEIWDRNGNKLFIPRDNQQRISKITTLHGRWIEFTYDTTDTKRITQIKDNIGRIISYQYDNSGRLWKVTNPEGGVTEYTYDYVSFTGNLLTIKDARNIVYLTNEYSNGRVSRQTMADNSVYLFNYQTDAAGKVTRAEVTDQRSNVRRVEFSNSYITSDIVALGKPEQQTFTYQRDPSTNLPLSFIDSLGRKTEFTYDPSENGNLLSVTTMADTVGEAKVDYTYETKFNEIQTVKDPLNHVTSFAYDDNGNVIGVKDPLEHETALTYTYTGQPKSIANALHHAVNFSYEFGDLVSVTNPSGSQALMLTDAAGRTLSVRNSLGQIIQYEYDKLNRITKVIDPVQGATSFEYDPNGNLKKLTDPRGKITTYTYDNMDRMKTRTDSLGGPTGVVTYDYDAAGNLTKLTDRRGKLTKYEYDGLDRLKMAGFGAVENGGATTYESTINYTYDNGDRLTQAVDSAAGTISRSYNDVARTWSQTTPQGSISYAYDAAGRLQTTTVTGQPAISYAYDNADRLTQITQGPSIVRFSYDDADRRTALNLPNGISLEYGYDNSSRLTSIAYKRGGAQIGDLTYGYDAANRVISTGGSYARAGLSQALPSALYDDANRLAQRGAQAFTYDANGNLIGDGARTYTWDARNQLASLSGQGVTASFQYDAFGRRTQKTINGQTTGYLYDGANVVQELAGGTALSNWLTGGVDEAFTRSDSSGARSFLTDGLGSTLALTDAAGAVQTSYTYDAFGNTTQSGTASSNVSQYAGRENDGTGLYYNRARYYSPDLQRFISQDPIGFGGGDSNLYAYVGNSPTNYTDPSGHIVDVAIDVASIAYDVYTIYTSGRGKDNENLKSLGLNVAGAVIPFATGLGAAYRASRVAKAANKATDAGRSIPLPVIQKLCFVAGTLVHTREGAVPIEAVREDDEVLSKNERTGQIEYQRVRQTFVREADEIVYVTIAGEETKPVGATDEHPFYVRRARSDTSGEDECPADAGEWLAAGELKAGDLVQRPSGEWAEVASLKRVKGRVKIYNFEVERNHNYFVGKLGTLVHNTCPGRITPGSLPVDEERAVLESLTHLDAGTRPPGMQPHGWGRPFRNHGGDLPGAPGTGGYREYDVLPPPGITNRGTRRIVVSDTDRSVYYTWTHYGDTGPPAFVRIR